MDRTPRLVSLLSFRLPVTACSFPPRQSQQKRLVNRSLMRETLASTTRMRAVNVRETLISTTRNVNFNLLWETLFSTTHKKHKLKVGSVD